jgi:uncharacterized membrane protein YeaQ/YmgE (transglycosylase-associated protein family)
MGGLILLVVLIIVGLAVASIVLSLATSLIGWLIIGLIAGFIASYIMKTRGDIITNLIYGILGSMLSGFVLFITGNGRLDNNLVGSLIFSTIGAIVLIGINRAFSGRNTPYTRY